MDEGYRTFDHTGDLGLEVWAESPERLFALAAEALFAQIAEAPAGSDEVRRSLVLTGDNHGDLIVHWLNTALLEAALHHAVWTVATVTALGPQRLEAVLAGQRLDPRRQAFLREIKAVSHHHLVLELDRVPCRCRMIVDL